MRTAALILPAFGSCVTGNIANSTDAILALGTTGETASTSLEEDIKTLECVIDHVNGRVPVIAGAGSNSSEMQKHKSVIYSPDGRVGAAVHQPLLCQDE